MMLRGIKGTFLYACDQNLQEYLKQFVPLSKITTHKTLDENHKSTKLIVSPYTKNMISVQLYESIGCGELMLADSASDETIEVPGWLIKPGAKYFALRTRGDSMNELGINDGDIILCQKNYQASTGSNAVVLVGDEATLKQIKYEKDDLVLIPKSSNPEHKIRKLTQEDEEFKVLGVFVAKI
jgi:SOS-response transcriptional repressor LexA